jgi:hypothetical protein
MPDRYFVDGGVDNNWGSTSNWSTTSGGAGGSSVPTSSDDVYFTAASPNCVVNASNRASQALNFTGYANTITMTFQITANGSVTLSAGMTIDGSAALVASATGTLTSNGKTWPNNLSFSSNSQVYTLADNWTVGSVSTLISSFSQTINGNTLSVLTDVTIAQTGGSIAGTTVLTFIGSGTFAANLANGVFRLPITFNTSGTVTLTGTLNYGTGTILYTSGTIDTSAATLQIIGQAVTLQTQGMSWNTVIFGGAATHTLNNNLSVAGTLTLGITTGNVVINGSAILFSGSSLTSTLINGSVTGTTVLTISETCTIGNASFTSGRVALPTTINAPGQTITINNTWNSNPHTWSLVAGTVVAGNTWVSGSSGLRFSRAMNGGYSS